MNQATQERHEKALMTEKPKRILIVDDDYDSIKPLERTLSSLGCYVQIATDANQAVELLSETPYDLVFLDWLLPEMKGGEAVKAAEESLAKDDDLYWSERMPIVTYSSSELKERKLPPAKHFAFIDHWKKPMAYGDLLMQVKEVLNYIDRKGH
jgi:CheY-like chemotaxis protein